MRVVFAHIKKYKILEDVTVNLDHAFSYSIISEQAIVKTPKTMPENFFAENLTMNCIIGKNGSGKTLLMDLLFDKHHKDLYESEYFILYDCNNHFCLKCTAQAKSHYYIYENDSDGVLRRKCETNHIKIMRDYHSYYLSCNNTNMLKTKISARWNDWSVGNERRFKTMHNIYEAYYYGLLSKNDSVLSHDLLNRQVITRVNLKWVEDLHFIKLNNEILNRHDFQRIIEANDVERLFCAVFLSVVFSRFSFKSHKEITSESFRYSLNAGLLELLKKYCLYCLDVIKDIKLNVEEEAFIEVFFGTLDNKTRIYGPYVDFTAHKHGDMLTSIFSDLAVTLSLKTPAFKFFINPPFSTGEWKRIEIASKLNQLAYGHHDEPVINIFLDEPDADLHPEIQTELVAWLVALLKGARKKINLIISTHNPIILSDFPGEAIISLGSRHSNQVKQTFGANVYELYKNSFGVENAIGMFAAEKIKRAILGKNKDIQLLAFLRSEISEPLIVNEIDKILDNATARDKIDAIYDSLTDEEIALLRKRMSDNDYE